MTSSALDLISGWVSNAASTVVKESVADICDRPLVVLVACEIGRNCGFLVNCDEVGRCGVKIPSNTSCVELSSCAFPEGKSESHMTRRK